MCLIDTKSDKSAIFGQKRQKRQNRTRPIFFFQNFVLYFRGRSIIVVCYELPVVRRCFDWMATITKK